MIKQVRNTKSDARREFPRRALPGRTTPRSFGRWLGMLPLVVTLLGCGSSAVQPAGGPATAPPTLVLATTTSARDSGLLDVLLPKFREETGITVDYVAVGTGQALEIGRRGDADLLLTHSRPADPSSSPTAHRTRSIRRSINTLAPATSGGREGTCATVASTTS